MTNTQRILILAMAALPCFAQSDLNSAHSQWFQHNLNSINENERKCYEWAQRNPQSAHLCEQWAKKRKALLEGERKRGDLLQDDSFNTNGNVPRQQMPVQDQQMPQVPSRPNIHVPANAGSGYNQPIGEWMTPPAAGTYNTMESSREARRQFGRGRLMEGVINAMPDAQTPTNIGNGATMTPVTQGRMAPVPNMYRSNIRPRNQRVRSAHASRRK